MPVPRLAVVLVVACVPGCGDGASTGEPAAPVREARVDLEIGSADGSGPDVFGRVGGLLELADGRIVVSDMLANEIRVFGKDGEHLFSFGREGDGPGDLGGPCCLALGPDGLVWIRETSNGRYSAFQVLTDRAEYRRSITQQHGASGLMAPTTFSSAGRLVDVGARPADGGGFERVRFHMDGSGEVVETEVAIPASLTDLGSHQVEGRINGQPALVFLWQPFASRAVSGHGPDGRWALGVSGRYELEAWQGAVMDTLRGELLEGPVLSAEERKAGREVMERDAGRVGLAASELPYDVPERRTPVDQIYYDAQGRLWVERSVPADSARLADVWNDEGEVVEQRRWPADVRLGLVGWVGSSHALGIRRDELGVEHVVRLRWD